MSLYGELKRYVTSGVVPMHMPGHKRNIKFYMENPYSIDITEVDGMDDLHQPQGTILELIQRAERFYKTYNTYLLVNGSTSGNQIAIASSCKRGDVILIDEVCHRSVENIAELLGLTTVHVKRPPFEYGSKIPGPLRSEDVEDALRRLQDSGHSPAAVVVTSPTYEGVTSDIRDIAAVVHMYGSVLIVDEAHGAHLTLAQKAGNLHLPWPEPATRQLADIVVESVHKTLPALTQTSLLHRCSIRVPEEKLNHYHDIFLTSSPSYVLMASIDQCMTWQETVGVMDFIRYDDHLNRIYNTAHVMMRRVGDDDRPVMRMLFPEDRDPSKLVLVGNGWQIAGLLREGGFEPERVEEDRVILMTSPGDDIENLHKFITWMLKL